MNVGDPQRGWKRHNQPLLKEVLCLSLTLWQPRIVFPVLPSTTSSGNQRNNTKSAVAKKRKSTSTKSAAAKKKKSTTPSTASDFVKLARPSTAAACNKEEKEHYTILLCSNYVHLYVCSKRSATGSNQLHVVTVSTEFPDGRMQQD